MIPGSNKQLRPFRRRLAGEAKRNRVEGATTGAITSWSTDLVHNNSGDLDWIEALRGSGRSICLTGVRPRRARSSVGISATNRWCLCPSAEEGGQEVLILVVFVRFPPEIDVVFARQPSWSRTGPVT